MAKVLTYKRRPLLSYSRRPEDRQRLQQFNATNAVTTLDLLQFTGSDLIGGLLNEVFRLVPEYSGENPIFGNRISVPARNVVGKRFEALVRTEAPRGDHFRDLNEPVGNKKAQRKKREFEMFPFMDFWEADKQMMEIAPDGGAALMKDDAAAILEGLVMDLGEYFYYGQEGADKRMFPGINQQLPKGRTYDAGGTGNNLTSIYFVWLDPSLKGVCWLQGNGGVFKTDPPSTRTRDEGTGKRKIVEQSIEGWLGLQVMHSKSVYRVVNVDISTALTKTPDPNVVTDELLGLAKAQFPSYMIPHVHMFMRTEAFRLWRASKGYLTDTGFAPPIGEFANFEGMRPVCTESIKANEGKVTVA